jgi:hypothetical protein
MPGKNVGHVHPFGVRPTFFPPSEKKVGQVEFGVT